MILGYSGTSMLQQTVKRGVFISEVLEQRGSTEVKCLLPVDSVHVIDFVYCSVCFLDTILVLLLLHEDG